MTTDAAWREAPWPAVRVELAAAEGQRVQANPAAQTWSASQGLAPGQLELAVQQWVDRNYTDARAAPIPVGHLGEVQATAVPLGDGSCLVWLLGSQAAPHLQHLPLAGQPQTWPDRNATAFLDRALVLAGVTVWRIDLQQQRVHYNAVGFKGLGIAQTPEGISLKRLRAMTHPEDAYKVELANEQASAGNKVVEAVVRFRYADGSWHHQLTRRVALRDEHGQVVGFSGVALDVTELHREREQPQRLHEHTALAAQALGVGFWSWQANREGQYTLVGDEQLHRIYASAPGQIAKDQAQWLRDFVHPDDRDWVAQRLQQAEASGEPLLDLRCRIVDSRGQERWLQRWTHSTVQQGRRATFGMELDVTDSQRALQERQRRRQREQFAIDAAGVGIWERDLQGHVLYWNETMYRLRGCGSDDPRHPDEIMEATTAAEDRALVKSVYLQHIAHGAPYRKELRVRLPFNRAHNDTDDNLRWILSHGRPVRNAQGQVVGMAGINLDVTERKNAALLETEKLRVEQASREKSAFMARMSHELRTPMNAVLGFSQLMRDDPAHALSGPQLKRLGLIEDAGHHLLKLINDLLEIAARSDAQPATAAVASSTDAAAPQPVAEAGTGAVGAQVQAQRVQAELAQTDAAQAALAPAQLPQTGAAPYLNVLCVEDNPVNLLLVREVLALRPAVQLRCAENGLSGVAGALEDPPDLLLLDLQLPDISGHEVLRQLRGQPTLAACRFVALSADAMPESIEAARAAGFDDYWTKPIQFDRFLAHIDQMLQQHNCAG